MGLLVNSLLGGDDPWNVDSLLGIEPSVPHPQPPPLPNNTLNPTTVTQQTKPEPAITPPPPQATPSNFVPILDKIQFYKAMTRYGRWGTFVLFAINI